jgi:hypothetical protein
VPDERRIDTDGSLNGEMHISQQVSTGIYFYNKLSFASQHGNPTSWLERFAGFAEQEGQSLRDIQAYESRPSRTIGGLDTFNDPYFQIIKESKLEEADHIKVSKWIPS